MRKRIRRSKSPTAIRKSLGTGLPLPDLFSSRAVPLPDMAELDRRVRQFNDIYFESALPTATVRWSSRLRIAGTCDRRRRLITLSRPYHEHFPGDVDDTLKHELLHLLHPGHNAAFRREAERIGASVHCREYPGLHPRARLLYVCPNCRTIYYRMRKEILFCGRCARGRRLDPRYILVLLSPIRRLARPGVAARGAPRARAGRNTGTRRPPAGAVPNLFNS